RQPGAGVEDLSEERTVGHVGAGVVVVIEARHALALHALESRQDHADKAPEIDHADDAAEFTDGADGGPAAHADKRAANYAQQPLGSELRVDAARQHETDRAAKHAEEHAAQKT